MKLRQINKIGKKEKKKKKILVFFPFLKKFFQNFYVKKSKEKTHFKKMFLTTKIKILCFFENKSLIYFPIIYIIFP